jgi:hypothetical protein
MFYEVLEPEQRRSCTVVIGTLVNVFITGKN